MTPWQWACMLLPCLGWGTNYNVKEHLLVGPPPSHARDW